MITAYELLMSAPGSQAKRAQIAFKAISAGRWLNAALALRNAADEEEDKSGNWAVAARKLAEYCERVDQKYYEYLCAKAVMLNDGCGLRDNKEEIL